MNKGVCFVPFGVALLAAASGATRAEDAAELAKQLANPVAALISAPIQAN